MLGLFESKILPRVKFALVASGSTMMHSIIIRINESLQGPRDSIKSWQVHASAIHQPTILRPNAQHQSCIVKGWQQLTCVSCTGQFCQQNLLLFCSQDMRGDGWNTLSLSYPPETNRGTKTHESTILIGEKIQENIKYQMPEPMQKQEVSQGKACNLSSQNSDLSVDREPPHQGHRSALA